MTPGADKARSGPKHTAIVLPAPIQWLTMAQNAPLVGVTITLAMLTLATSSIFLAGGTHTAMPHLLYLPVIVAAFLLGLRAAMLTGLLAGLACGPFMPLDVAANIPQSLPNWLVRTAYFIIAGGLVGGFASLLSRQLSTLRHSAFRNPVTGLPNRAAFQEDVDRMILEAEATGGTLAIVKVRITELEPILSTFGYDQGDTLLNLVGDRLSAIIPLSGTLYNIGPGRFAVALTNGSKEKACTLALRLLEMVRAPTLLEDIPVSIDGHAGIALYPTHGQHDALALLRAVSQATNRADERDLDYMVFDPASDDEYRDRVLLMSDLREAAPNNQLELHFQPLIDLRSGKCVGAEALIRWHHPTRGLVPPDVFIPLAETTGLIGPLSLWVAQNGVAELAEWRRRNLDLHLSINISAYDLESSFLMRSIESLLLTHDIEPSRLILEVTESAAISSQRTGFTMLERLISRGIGVAIDDFGVGRSSLACLRDMPATTLKLDRGFCTKLTEDPRQQRVVQATVDMAHEFGLNVVAEGIETQETYDLLLTLGCDQGQGYLMSRPLPQEAFHRWLEAQEIQQPTPPPSPA